MRGPSTLHAASSPDFDRKLGRLCGLVAIRDLLPPAATQCIWTYGSTLHCARPARARPDPAQAWCSYAAGTHASGDYAVAISHDKGVLSDNEDAIREVVSGWTPTCEELCRAAFCMHE
jgi:hypothetical protein